jgi:hypothetical protein
MAEFRGSVRVSFDQIRALFGAAEIKAVRLEDLLQARPDSPNADTYRREVDRLREFQRDVRPYLTSKGE